MRIMTNKKKGSKNLGKVYDYPHSYHHDLGKALECIVKQKTNDKEDISSLSAYLAWHESTIHSLADRVLRQRAALTEAMEINKVM